MITLILILLTFWGGSFIVLRHKSLKASYITKAIISLMIAVTCTIGYLLLALAYRPSGPFEPIATTEFFFDKPGTKDLTFTPKFFREHEVAILASPPFPVKEQFNWKVNVQVYRLGIKIDEHELVENHRGLVKSSLDNCHSISFGWIRTLDLVPGKTSVRINVLQGDPSAAKYASSFKVVVRPSPII
jgi:hypothetical protein